MSQFFNYLTQMGNEVLHGVHSLPIGHQGGVLHHLGIGHDDPQGGPGVFERQKQAAPSSYDQGDGRQPGFPIAGPDSHEDPELHGLSAPFADAIGGLKKLAMGWHT